MRGAFVLLRHATAAVPKAVSIDFPGVVLRNLRIYRGEIALPKESRERWWSSWVQQRRASREMEGGGGGCMLMPDEGDTLGFVCTGFGDEGTGEAKKTVQFHSDGRGDKRCQLLGCHWLG